MSEEASSLYKTRLHDILQSALSTEDPEQMNKLFHLVADTSNCLRRKYGLPVDIHRQETSVLKCSRQQMTDMGAEMFRQVGGLVYSQCTHPTRIKTVQDGKSLFDKCFNSTIHSQRYRDRAMDISARKLGHYQNMVILPPLLARTDENQTLKFRLDTDGIVQEHRMEKIDILIIFFAEGPIIPVCCQKVCPDLRPFLMRWYAVEGLLKPMDFWQEFALR